MGLFYCHDTDEITFIQFYRNGEVLVFSKSIDHRQSQSPLDWFDIESEKVYYYRGLYALGADGELRITAAGENRQIVFRGCIVDRYTLRLACRVNMTKHIKGKIYKRFTERENFIKFEIRKGIDG